MQAKREESSFTMCRPKIEKSVRENLEAIQTQENQL